MPTHLSAEQRELVYKLRNRKSLTTDPVVANLGGEEFTLQPIDRTTDVPPLRKSLFNALDLMKTKADWDILPRLLEGLRHAGLKLSTAALNSIVRKTARAGREDIILASLREVEATGFQLNRSEFVRQILWCFQSMAMNSDFDVKTTKKALAWSEQIFDMIELPAHAGEGLAAGEVDPRTQSLSVGILLELAAARALKHLDGKDVDGKVAKYAEMMASTSLHFGSPTSEKATRHWCSERLPVLFGMRAALKILDPTSETAKKLKAASDSLGETTDGYLKKMTEMEELGNKFWAVTFHKKLSSLFLSLA